MTRWFIVAGLLVLNGILGVGVYQRLMERSTHAAMAGMGGVAGPRAELLTVTGMSKEQMVIYVMDPNTGILQVRRVDIANKRIEAPIQQNVGNDLRRIP